MRDAVSHCCLCGLMCPVAPEGGLIAIPGAAESDCPRRTAWFDQIAASSGSARRARPANGPLSPTVEEGESSAGAQIAELLRTAGKPLLWIDAVDVHTLGAAVELARVTGATLHVGTATGPRIVRRVVTTEGWLGTSLAEIAAHADLIITVGGGILSEAPLLASRYLQPAVQAGRADWYHIGDLPFAMPTPPLPSGSTDQGGGSAAAAQHLPWPRSDWYARLTDVLLGLRDDSRATPTDPSTMALVGALRGARNAVWLWDVDEFHDSIAELTVRRILGIARRLSTTSRCGLLALDANVGRATADEALAWLTGHHGTVRHDGVTWRSLDGWDARALRDWEREFDAIVIVRSLPSLRPLPDLRCERLIASTEGSAWIGGGAAPTIRVGAVGRETSGYVFRGDRVVVLPCHPLAEGRDLEDAPAESAESVLRDARDRWMAWGGRDVA